MSELFKSIKRGLEEAIQYSEGKPVKAVVHKVSRARACARRSEKHSRQS